MCNTCAKDNTYALRDASENPAPLGGFGGDLHPPVMGAPLDTLAQLRKNENKLQKRARSKALNYATLGALMDLRSPLYQHYCRATSCCSEMELSNGKLTARYCNSRACLICNRIRTAKLINGYTPAVKKMISPALVTLTKPAVKGKELKDSIEEMLIAFRKISTCLRKRGTPIIGIRKLEITYNPDKNWYHAHYHLIVDGINVGHDIVDRWLRHYTNASSKAQDVRRADVESLSELFKYVTKPPVDDSGEIHYKAMDTILQAVYRKRTVQALGGVKRQEVDENVTAEDANILIDHVHVYDEFHWVQELYDWVSQYTGAMLSNYAPSEKDLLKLKKPPP